MRIFSIVLICVLAVGLFSCGSSHPIHRRLGSSWAGVTLPSLAVLPVDALGNRMVLALNRQADDLVFLAPEVADVLIKLESDPRGYFSITAESRARQEVILERVWALVDEEARGELVDEFAQDFATNLRGVPR